MRASLLVFGAAITGRGFLGRGRTTLVAVQLFRLQGDWVVGAYDRVKLFHGAPFNPEAVQRVPKTIHLLG